MADDSDIPPLEDMTEVLKQAANIKTGMRDTLSADKPTVKIASAKDRAKVKKCTTAKVVKVETQSKVEAGGDRMEKTTVMSTPAEKVSPSPTSSQPLKSTKGSGMSSGGMFGGMKKGFLFGGSSLSSSSSQKRETEPVKPAKLQVDKPEKINETNDIPYISPQPGKTQSGLTLDEVQQAMAEAKGLLDNQDWINDDLLNKVEKNDLLLKRFADPQFMKALEEFQTNPVAAMEKYKGNTEVEKFLMEFCKLLGDHFTNLGDSSASATESKNSLGGKSHSTHPSGKQKNFNKSEPKIIELTESEETKSSQCVEQTSSCNQNLKAAKVIELSDSEQAPLTAELSLSKSATTPVADIRIHSDEQADIQEVSVADDAKVKEILKDPQVMETLMDPRIMNLIYLVQADYEKAQRIVETADAELKEKIKLLVTKGLLQFQA